MWNSLTKFAALKNRRDKRRGINGRVRLSIDTLEDRRLLTVSTPIVINVNDNWALVHDNGDLILSTGDVVESSNDAGHTGIRSLYGGSGPDPTSPSTILPAAFGSATTSTVPGMASLAGTGGHITIGDALAANDHGRINVLPGEYDEDVIITLQQSVQFADGVTLVHYAVSDPMHLSPHYRSLAIRNQLGNVHTNFATDGVTNTSGAADIIIGDFTLANGSTFVATNEHARFHVLGTLSPNGADLNAAFLDEMGLASFIDAPYTLEYEPFVLINNEGSDAVVGVFNGLPEGATLSTDGVGGVFRTYTISYVGGDGNDITLTEFNSPTSSIPGNAGQNVYQEVSRQTSELILGLANANTMYGDPDPSRFQSIVVHHNRSEDIGVSFDFDGFVQTAYHYNSATGESYSDIVNRQLFYNNSFWDKNDTGIHVSLDMFTRSDDDKAVASDKIALLPGHLATFLNYSSYTKGINGVMVDISHLPKDVYGAPVISLSDFTFKVGNNNMPSGWSAAPTPSGIAVRKGAGSAMSDRVVITWNDGDIVNEWLQVTITANANTGIVADDVFYFGNQIGDSGLGNTANGVAVNATDVLAALNNPRNIVAKTTPVTFFVDYNRDGQVNITDRNIALNNSVASFAGLQLFTPPVSTGVLPYALNSPPAYTDFGLTRASSAILFPKSGGAPAAASLQSLAAVTAYPPYIFNRGGSTPVLGTTAPDVHVILTAPVSAADWSTSGYGTANVDALEAEVAYTPTNTPASELQNMEVTGRHYSVNRGERGGTAGAGGQSFSALSTGGYDEVVTSFEPFFSEALFPETEATKQSWTISSSVLGMGAPVVVTGALRVSRDEFWDPNSPAQGGEQVIHAKITLGGSTVVDVYADSRALQVNGVSSDFGPEPTYTYENDGSICIPFLFAAQVGEDVDIQFASYAYNLATAVGYEQRIELTAGFSIDIQVS